MRSPRGYVGWWEHGSAPTDSWPLFIDETGVTTKMVRHYGRSPCGARPVASVPHRPLENSGKALEVVKSPATTLGTPDARYDPKQVENALVRSPDGQPDRGRIAAGAGIVLLRTVGDYHDHVFLAAQIDVVAG